MAIERVPSHSDLVDAQFVQISGPDGTVTGFRYDEQQRALYFKESQLLVQGIHGKTHIAEDPIPSATCDTPGLMSEDDKCKLDSLIGTRVGVLGFQGAGFPNDGGWIQGDIILAAGTEFISLERIGNVVRFTVDSPVPMNCACEECTQIFWLQDETDINAVRLPVCNGKLPGINGYGELKIYLFPESTIADPNDTKTTLNNKGQHPSLIFKRYDNTTTPGYGELSVILKRDEENTNKAVIGWSFTPGALGVPECLWHMGLDDDGNQLSFELNAATEPGMLGSVLYNGHSITKRMGVIVAYSSSVINSNSYIVRHWNIDRAVAIGDPFSARNVWQYNNPENPKTGPNAQKIVTDSTIEILPIGTLIDLWAYKVGSIAGESIYRWYFSKKPALNNLNNLWAWVGLQQFGDIAVAKDELAAGNTDDIRASEDVSAIRDIEKDAWGLTGFDDPLLSYDYAVGVDGTDDDIIHLNMTGDIRQIGLLNSDGNNSDLYTFLNDDDSSTWVRISASNGGFYAFNVESSSPSSTDLAGLIRRAYDNPENVLRLKVKLHVIETPSDNPWAPVFKIYDATNGEPTYVFSRGTPTHYPLVTEPGIYEFEGSKIPYGALPNVEDTISFGLSISGSAVYTNSTPAGNVFLPQGVKISYVEASLAIVNIRINRPHSAIIDTSLPGLRVVSNNESMNDYSERPVYFWNRRNLSNALMRIDVGKPESSSYTPYDILLRAQIDSYDGKYMKVLGKGKRGQSQIISSLGDNYLRVGGVHFHDLPPFGTVRVLNGHLANYTFKYVRKLMFPTNILTEGTEPIRIDGTDSILLVADKNDPNVDLFAEGFEGGEIVELVHQEYNNPIVRLEFTVDEQTQLVRLQFKVGMLDMSIPYELNEDGVTDDYVRGLASGYAVSAVYSQTGAYTGVGTRPESSLDQFVVYDGGVQVGGDEDEYWNRLEIMVRDNQVWIWWNSLLIPPSQSLSAELASPVAINTPYFTIPTNPNKPTGKFGCRMWPGATLRRFDIRTQISTFSEFTYGQLEIN